MTDLSFSVSAPGKLFISGENAALLGRTAIAASVSLRTFLNFQSGARNKDNKIEFDLPTVNLHHWYDIDEITKRLLTEPVPLLVGSNLSSFNMEKPHLIDFSKLQGRVKEYVCSISSPVALTSEQECALISFFCLLTGIFSCVSVPLEKFRITVTTQQVIGCGLGSSAAYCVCIAAALIHFIRSKLMETTVLGKDISRKGLKTLKFWSIDLDGFDNREKTMISHWAFLGDRVMHRSPSGIDNTISTFGSIMRYKKMKQLRTADLTPIPNSRLLRALLIHSGVARDASQIATTMMSVRERYPAVLNAILNAIDGISIEAAKIIEQGSPTTEVSSNSIWFEANAEYELEKLGELIDMNQVLVQALGLSHSKQDHICRLIKKFGFHSRVTGVGNTGYIYVLIPTAVHQSRLNALKTLIERRAMKYTEVQLGGPGLKLHNISNFRLRYSSSAKNQIQDRKRSSHTSKRFIPLPL